MSESNGLPKSAQAVVIGAGIGGNSLVYHLARLGWKDLVQIDKGPLPNPGGSTGHASNFIFPVDHNKEMTALTRDTARQYEELGVLTISGGIEVARTKERMEEFGRRMASSLSWGEPDCEVITPDRVVELVPYVNKDVILGGFYTPGVSVVDSLRAGTLMREYAQEHGGLVTSASTEVTGIDVVDGRVKTVHTNKGSVDCETLFICCGVWSPRIARMAGATIPLTPAVHQMISVGPIPLFSDTKGEIEYPIIRDVDTNCYERQNGSDMEVGSYAHRAILMSPDDIPSNEEAALSPTELPFTAEDFDLQMEQALELMPEILTAEGAGIRHAINGLLSLTPDGMPLLGETEVKGVWSLSAVWIKEAAGIARAVAEWATEGHSEIDLHGSDISRLYAHQRTRRHIDARSDEGYNRTYGIVHPMEQWLSNREVRLSPFYAREQELGAVFYETAGWERPWWYESNKGLLEEYGGDKVMPREAEWESRWWSPIINAEHLAMRDRAALIDLSAFAIFDVVGSGALEYLQRVALAECDVEVGRVIYTPILNKTGTFETDLTIMRLGDNHFRVVTGGMDGMRDMKWFGDLLPADGSVTLLDMTSAWCTAGLWGPRARDILSSVTSADISHEGFPFARWRWIEVGPVRVMASRISYVGELGWELYAPMEQGRAMWDAIWEAGQPHGLIPSGIGVYGTTGRIEKGYRLFGAELESEYNVVEAGMQRPTVKDADFVGKEAHLRHREEEPAAILSTLTIDDPTSSSGVKRYPIGREPILAADGSRLVDAHGRASYVTSAGSGPSVGKHVLMSYLPREHAVEGNKLLVQYMGERYPVTVEVAGSRSLFDPENTRVRS